MNRENGKEELESDQALPSIHPWMIKYKAKYVREGSFLAPDRRVLEVLKEKLSGKNGIF